MKLLILLSTLCVCACSSKPVNELDAMSKEVLKAKEGIDIQIKPLQEEKGVPIVSKQF